MGGYIAEFIGGIVLAVTCFIIFVGMAAADERGDGSAISVFPIVGLLIGIILFVYGGWHLAALIFHAAFG